MTKSEKSLEACEKVLNGIEDDTLTTSAALLLCLKVARLTNDIKAIEWLQYEYGGYPKTADGKFIQSDAFAIAYTNGRGYIHEGDKCIFSELASELEEKIKSEQNAINNFSTQGVSVSGEWAMSAMNNLTGSVTRATTSILSNIALNQKRLSILKSKYYDYALKNILNYLLGMLRKIYLPSIEQG